MNKTLEAVEKDLGEARKALENEKGREAEVYSRIVGYYRSVRNWNKGKREEYGERKTFNPDVSEMLDESADSAVCKENAAEEQSFSERASFAAAKDDGLTGQLSVNIETESVAQDGVCESCRIPGVASSRTESAGLFASGENTDAPRLLLFVQPGCPACPEAKTQADEIARSYNVKMETFQADTETGFAEAMRRGVVATPTAILLNSRGVELSRANDSTGLADIRKLLENAA